MNATIDRLNRYFERLPDTLRTHRRIILVLFALITVTAGFGIRHVVIDESLDAYFHNNAPVKQAYDKFRRIFGGDEYVYVVYRARDNDIFSPRSVAALKELQDALSNYRLDMAPGESSPLDHIEEVKSLINVRYMEGTPDTLYSKNFIGDTPVETPADSGRFRHKALAHPDFPLIYLSRNSHYGGIMIRTDFNAERTALSNAMENEDILFDGAGGSGETEPDSAGLSDVTVSPEQAHPEVRIERSDIREYPEFMAEIRSILGQEQYAGVFEFYPVGNPVLMDFFTKAVIEDMGRLMSLVLLLIVIMLWLLFRSFSAVVWPVLIVGVTIVWILGLIGFSGLPQSAMLQVILFLCLSVGIADAVHILSGYLFFRNSGQGHEGALRAVMRKSGLACLLTSVTTAIGLLSLVFVPLKPISFFGIFAAVAVLLAFVFTIVLLPLMLDFWSPVPKKSTGSKDHLVLKTLKRIERVGTSHSPAVILVFLILAVILGVGLSRLRVDSNFVEIIKEGLPLRSAYTVVDEHMAGTGNMEIMIDLKKENGLKDPAVLFAMQDLQAFLENNGSLPVVKTMSLVNVVKESYKVLNADAPSYYAIPDDPDALGQVLFLFENANPRDRSRLVTDDYSKARIGIHSTNVGSIKALDVMETVQDYIDDRFAPLKQTYPGLEVTLTGNMALLAIMLDYLAWAQIKSFGIALVVISMILFLVLGSARAGLVALASNLFPILTSFGLMGFFGIPLDADTLLIAPIIIGLAVDDTIHFLTHFRLEIQKTRDIVTASVMAIRESGQAIAFTSLILSAGFLVFILSFHNGVSRFGIFAAIAILSALICDMLLLPALCKTFNVNFNRKLAR